MNNMFLFFIQLPGMSQQAATPQPAIPAVLSQPSPLPPAPMVGGPAPGGLQRHTPPSPRGPTPQQQFPPSAGGAGGYHQFQRPFIDGSFEFVSTIVCSYLN